MRSSVGVYIVDEVAVSLVDVFEEVATHDDDDAGVVNDDDDDDCGVDASGADVDDYNDDSTTPNQWKSVTYTRIIYIYNCLNNFKDYNSVYMLYKCQHI